MATHRWKLNELSKPFWYLLDIRFVHKNMHIRTVFEQPHFHLFLPIPFCNFFQISAIKTNSKINCRVKSLNEQKKYDFMNWNKAWRNWLVRCFWLSVMCVEIIENWNQILFEALSLYTQFMSWSQLLTTTCSLH